MEISSLQDSSIRIKTKTVEIVVDPKGVSDAEVNILTEDTGKVFERDEAGKLIIKGPGEYEVKGVTITGEDKSGDIIYRVNDGQYTIILAASSVVNKVVIEDDESVGAVVFRLNAKFDEGALGSLSSSLIILYGNEEFAPQKNITKKEKVNLKKKEELESSIVFLSR